MRASAILGRLRQGGADVLLSAAAAGLSWWIATALLGDRLPGTAWTRRCLDPIEDACVGAAIALLCAQALFSADLERVLVGAALALADLGDELGALPPGARDGRASDGLKAAGRASRRRTRAHLRCAGLDAGRPLAPPAAGPGRAVLAEARPRARGLGAAGLRGRR